jgi:hypothetical protein
MRESSVSRPGVESPPTAKDRRTDSARPPAKCFKVDGLNAMAQTHDGDRVDDHTLASVKNLHMDPDQKLKARVHRTGPAAAPRGLSIAAARAWKEAMTSEV